MAQSTIIQVTVDYIGNTPMGGVARGLDVQNFAGPVKVGPLGTYIRYVEGGAYSIKQNEPTAVQTYIVQESLADIALVGEGMVVLTVERFGKTYNIGTILGTSEQMLFDVNKFANEAAPNGTGCEFYYRETGAADPVYYLVSESLSAIIAAVPVGPPGQITGVLTPPAIPYASAASTLSDSGLSYDLAHTAVRIGAGVKLASPTNGEAEITNNSAVDEWYATTDGGVGNESYLLLTPTDAWLMSADGGMHSEVSKNTVSHGSQVIIDAPAVQIAQNIIVSGTPLESKIDFGTGNSVIASTDNGALAEGAVWLTPTSALIGLNPTNPAGAFASFTGSDAVLYGSTVSFKDSGAIDVQTLAGVFSMFNTNASIVNFGKSGGTLNVASTLAMQAATVQLAAATNAGLASAIIAPGVAPGVLTSGMIYSDGTHIYWVDNGGVARQLDN